jgi:hypothetical protein
MPVRNKKEKRLYIAILTATFGDKFNPSDTLANAGQKNRSAVDPSM